jgi:mono/diheme cytochrome c family protein
MKRPIFYMFFLIVAARYLGSCTSASKEMLLPAGCKTDDTLYVVSYTTDVVPIFESNCYACHGSTSHDNSGVNLQDTTVLNHYIENGQLLANITQTPGTDYDPMPKNAAKLDTCEISIIHQWIRQGYPQN